MSEHLDENGNGRERWLESFGANRWLLVGIVALIVVAGIAFGYGYRQQILVGHLTAQESMANATINEMQGQLNTVTAKLKEMKDTQDQVAKNRTDLEGNLSSTRDELNGSIAKTHDELVVLQKRGERNYFEFDLAKSKQFQRFGPLTLSLRRAYAKHMNYDMSMVVDDNQLSKKRVNLYEPIWIHTENESQPVQVVVNKISKNFVHGYISAPKYKPSDLAASDAAAATVTPVAEHPQPQPPSDPNPNPQIPKEPE